MLAKVLVSQMEAIERIRAAEREGAIFDDLELERTPNENYWLAVAETVNEILQSAQEAREVALSRLIRTRATSVAIAKATGVHRNTVIARRRAGNA